MNNILYSSKNISLLEKNADSIYDDATKLSYNILEPYQNEYIQIKDIIRSFIKKNNRIIYGGTAYYEIIKSNKKNNKNIYKLWQRYDIEFYSPTPIKDLTIICKLLYKANFKYIVGKQSQHNETYSVFANFIQYCDITYMTQSIYDKIDTINIDDMLYIHPNLILIDIYRIYTDPLTSYWRLNKVIKRMKILLSSYKYNFNTSKPIHFTPNNYNNLLKYVIDNILNTNYKCIMTGQLAYLFYTSSQNSVNINLIEQLEIFSDDIENITNEIKKIILQYFYNIKKLNSYEKIFNVKNYSKFFQYWDKRTIFYLNLKPFITVIGSNNRCLPYIEKNIDNLKVYISSFILTFNYFFIGYYYEKIHNTNFYFKEKNILNSLLTSRNKYLSKHKKSVLDNTVYKEFIVNCIGLTMDSTREYLLRLSENKIKGTTTFNIYDPSKYFYFEEKYEQSDGLEIKKIDKN